jgi:hypothetical protein
MGYVRLKWAAQGPRDAKTSLASARGPRRGPGPLHLPYENHGFPAIQRRRYVVQYRQRCEAVPLGCLESNANERIADQMKVW